MIFRINQDCPDYFFGKNKLHYLYGHYDPSFIPPCQGGSPPAELVEAEEQGVLNRDISYFIYNLVYDLCTAIFSPSQRTLHSLLPAGIQAISFPVVHSRLIALCHLPPGIEFLAAVPETGGESGKVRRT